ncbi:MAG TPA: YihY/virulence factor BrkB family protein [Steroidobacteraceae bacterium]|nr:YihY/virulence factor BrkB family protein [Steroidobacteraceae bacterium]
MRNYWRSFEAALFDPRRTGLVRPVMPALVVLRYVYAIIRDLIFGDLNMRAMSLVYTTLLSIVPLIAFCFSIVKGLGFEHDLEPLIYQFFEPLGDRGVQLTRRVIGFVDHAQGGVLGSLGLAFLVWTVISVIQKVEESFNHIWHVEQARSLGRRLSEYLSVMVAGPIVIVVGLGLVASISTQSLLLWLGSHPPFAALLQMLGRLAPWLVVTIGFAFLYSFVPNTRVRLRFALAAGMAAGAAWVAASLGFTQLVTYSTRTMAIYASFAIVLFALMWVWLNWLILLTGTLLAFYLQNPQYLRSGQRDVVPTARLSERLALSVMYLVAQAFASGERRWTVETLSETLAVPSIALGPVVDALEAAGLLESTEHEAVIPARDPSGIMLDAVLTAVREGKSGRAVALRQARLVAPAEALCDRLDAAIREQLGRISLHDFVGTAGDAPRPAG